MKLTQFIAATALLAVGIYLTVDSSNQIEEASPTVELASTAVSPPSRVFKDQLTTDQASSMAVTLPIATKVKFSDLDPHPTMPETWLVAHGFVLGSVRGRLHDLLDGRTELTAASAHSIAVRPSANTFPGDGEQASRLLPQEHYVHTSLPLALTTGEDSVIVRWRQLSDQSVIELSSQAMPANSNESINLWMHRKDDWAPGSYRVEVISANPKLELLAAGNFEIVKSGRPTTAFAYPVNLRSE